MGKPGTGCPGSFARLGAARSSTAVVQTTATKSARPGSVKSKLDGCLGKDCESSSQTFRHDALDVSAPASWLAMTPAWPAEISGLASVAEDCVTGDPWLWVSRASSRHALAIPEAKANSHTSSTTNVMLRLTWLLDKRFMVGWNCYEFSLGSPSNRRIDICQSWS